MSRSATCTTCTAAPGTTSSNKKARDRRYNTPWPGLGGRVVLCLVGAQDLSGAGKHVELRFVI